MKYKKYLIALALLVCGACVGAPTKVAAHHHKGGSKGGHSCGHHKHHCHRGCSRNCGWNFSFASCSPAYVPYYTPVCVPVVYQQPVVMPQPCMQVVQPVYVLSLIHI